MQHIDHESKVQRTLYWMQRKHGAHRVGASECGPAGKISELPEVLRGRMEKSDPSLLGKEISSGLFP